MNRPFAMLSALSCALMTAQVAEGGEGAAAVSTAIKIRPDLKNYVSAKSASGAATKICGDDVSKALLGASLDEAYGFVSGVVGIAEADLRAKYGARNLGQQRMFLGNLIRGAFAGKDTEKAARVREAFQNALPAFRKAIDARLESAAKEKEAEKTRKAQEKADAKAAAQVKKDLAKASKAAEKAKTADAAPKAPAPKAPTAPKAPAPKQ